jgi:SAM-dependent methyltransferase
MNIDNQTAYWNSAGADKTFTHPIDHNLLEKFVDKQAKIVDYGCGYGRILRDLAAAGFVHLSGYDSSRELVRRAQVDRLPVEHINGPADLPLADDTIDCFLLFAVLTCVPSNAGQESLVQLLHSKLKTGGIIYISDYYLQQDGIDKGRYSSLNKDPHNFGVFTLPEGATLRHHTKSWVTHLAAAFTKEAEQELEIKTMNGNRAAAFQMILRK